jgi:DNA replication licensing factor MCM7
MNNRHPDIGTDNVVFTPHEVRSYVAQARTYRPVVPESVSDYMIKTYVRMRDQQQRAEKKGKQFTHTTPRTLLGVVRLAQALARLRFSNQVSQDDVDEALRLIEASKETLNAEANPGRRGLNASSRIYNLVKALADSGGCRAEDAEDDDLGIELSMRKVKERVIAKGFTEDQWLNALEEYTTLDVSTATVSNGAVSRLIHVYRSGKPLATERDWCLSLPVMMMTRTMAWMFKGQAHLGVSYLVMAFWAIRLLGGTWMVHAVMMSTIHDFKFATFCRKRTTCPLSG